MTRAQIQLLTEIADLLLSQGITPKQLQQLMEPAFANAAARGARLRNGRVSYSRIAARTGMRRAAVRDLLRKGHPGPIIPNPLDRLVLAWRQDSDFLDIEGRPRLLTIGGNDDAFGRLARKYVPDIPKRALIHELLEAGLASTRGRALRLRKSKRSRSALASKSVHTAVIKLLKSIRAGFPP